MVMAKKPRQIVMREYLESLLVAVLLAFALRFFVISAYKIPTGSMVPTLKVGDFIFAYRLPYRLGAQLPKRGDVVVFRYPGNEQVNYVKRVIGLPGDKISIKDRKLFVNESEAHYQELPSSVISDLPGNEFYKVFEEDFAHSRHLVINSKEGPAESFGPIVVAPGQVFVLGDNRDSSDDSRYWGTVPVQNLEGRVVLVWMSFDWLARWGNERFPSVRWSRVFTSVR